MLRESLKHLELEKFSVEIHKLREDA